MLLENIRNVFAFYDPEKYLISDNDMERFLNHCTKTLGYDEFSGPREITKGFVKALSLLEKNPDMPIGKILEDSSILNKKSEGKLAKLKL